MRVEARQRTVYTVRVGSRRRHFLSPGAAYYAIAKALLGEKYLGPLKMEHDDFQYVPDPERTKERAERARDLFVLTYREGDEFSTDKWQAYVRRVARKLRLMAEYRAQATATTDQREGGGE